MSKPRVQLHEQLCNILGSNQVYYQPPESVKMKYPAIVYSRINIDSTYANNTPYTLCNTYRVTVIDKSPISPIVEKIAKLPMCSFNTHYASDNLNHDVFTLYY